MLVEKTYSNHAACVVECSGPLSLSISTFLVNRLLICFTLLVRYASVPARLAFFASGVLALKRGCQIAKRTQFLSKTPVLQILTTKKFLFQPKANLMT